jgi:hypothetical protein
MPVEEEEDITLYIIQHTPSGSTMPLILSVLWLIGVSYFRNQLLREFSL